MHVEVAVPGAWALAPLQKCDWITDPGLEDNPPRYKNPIKGGWTAVHEAIMFIFGRVQRERLDVTAQVFRVDVGTTLNRHQEAAVYTWFSVAIAPQWSPGSSSWINGRHRSWGLKQAGFEFAPVLVIPLGDAIEGWDAEEDSWGPGPLGIDDLLSQKLDLSWWQTSLEAREWRLANPELAGRWAEIIRRWEQRLSSK